MSGAWGGRRALVLGATGFIGRWVARSLGEGDAELHLAVRDASIAASVLPAYSVAGTVHVVDLRDPAAVAALIAEARPWIVFNLAGYGVDPTQRDEASAYALNRDLVNHLCDALADTSTRLIHTGSALEYGRARGDLHEETVPEPDTLYGRSKLAGTRALAHRRSRDGIVGLTARLFMVYGPGERAGRLLPTLLDARNHTRRIALTEGRQRRDFTFVGDVAEGLLRLGLAAPDAPDVVNLATGRLHSVREFVDTAARVAGLERHRLGYGDLPGRAEEMAHEPVAVGRLRTTTGGWTPPTDIEAGIRATLDGPGTAPPPPSDPPGHGP